MNQGLQEYIFSEQGAMVQSEKNLPTLHKHHYFVEHKDNTSMY